MLAKPTLPLVPTVFDLGARGPLRRGDGFLFEGWGVPITGNRIQ